jgi:hypothetical protein
MEIKIEEVEKLKIDSDKIFLSAEGERTLIQLLEIQKQVEEAIDEAKKRLEYAALKMNPNFTSIQADKIKVYYRSYGERYKIDESQIASIPKGLYSTKVNYKAIAEEVERWTEEHKGMPVGIIEAERPKSLSFSLKTNGRGE